MSMDNVHIEQPKELEASSLERRKNIESIFDSLKELDCVKLFLECDSMISPDDYTALLGDKDKNREDYKKKAEELNELKHSLEIHPDVQLYVSLRKIFEQK